MGCTSMQLPIHPPKLRLVGVQDNGEKQFKQFESFLQLHGNRIKN